MAKYWVYMREDYRIGSNTLDLKSIQFRRSSSYAGEPLKYLPVPCTIKGEVLELSDEKLAAIKAEVASLNIVPHHLTSGAFVVSKQPGDPIGKLITILPLAYAHERGYLHYPSPDPFETL